MKKIELSLMKSMPLEDINLKYTDFIILSLNNLLIDVITTEKGNMSVDISMESTGIKDMETQLNKEFQNIIDMSVNEELTEREKKMNKHLVKKVLELYGIEIRKERKEEKEEKKRDENEILLIEENKEENKEEKK